MSSSDGESNPRAISHAGQIVRPDYSAEPDPGLIPHFRLHANPSSSDEKLKTRLSSRPMHTHGPQVKLDPTMQRLPQESGSEPGIRATNGLAPRAQIGLPFEADAQAKLAVGPDVNAQSDSRPDLKAAMDPTADSTAKLDPGLSSSTQTDPRPSPTAAILKPAVHEAWPLSDLNNALDIALQEFMLTQDCQESLQTLQV